MGIFDFLRGEFIDVIHWTDDTRDTMVWRFDRAGHAITYGAKLTVREGQAAVFVHEGRLADVFTPGLYMLETNTMPVMTRLQHWDHGFRSPFKSEIYFVSTRRFNGLKWGTKSPVMLRDPEFGAMRLRAYGTYSVRVNDPATFLTEIVGTDGTFTMDEISDQIRNVIVQAFARTIAGSGIPVLDMAANTGELGELVAADISGVVAAYGLTIPEFYIENVSLPPAVEAALDDRTSAGLARGAGLAGETGAGAPPASEPAAGEGAVPPPPPAETVWHIAEGGETHGPYSRVAMARMATEGRLRRDSFVWTPGQEGWLRAEAVPELAGLFTARPPPPPGG
jgi:membrane protease subunit (stomatin/prohibitin family)